jgi:hypothetical protein
MIKLILIGLWACAVTLASCYAAVSLHSPSAAPEPASHGAAPVIETVKSRMISVPVIADGAIHGYVMAQFMFTVDGKVMKSLSIKPDIFLLDEAFKAIFTGENVDFRQFKKQDLPGLSKKIGEGVNKRLGVHLIEDVLVHELNYIPKDRVRAGEPR